MMKVLLAEKMMTGFCADVSIKIEGETSKGMSWAVIDMVHRIEEGI